MPAAIPACLGGPGIHKNRTGAVTWKLDGDTLTGDDTAYTRYLLPPGYRVAQSSCYVYGNKIRASDGGLYSVRRPLHSTDFVWLSGRSRDVVAVFATPDGTAALKRFLSDGQGSYALYPETGTRSQVVAPVTADWLNALPGAGEHRMVDVRTLLDMPLCAIRFSDATGCVYTVSGGLYTCEEGYLYVDYRALGNQHFDADGNFSYRSGNVDAVLLRGDAALAVQQTIDSAAELTPDVRYEDYGEIPWEENNESAVPVFWVFYVLNGFLVPVAPLVVGLVMAHSDKHGRQKRWYILSGIAGVWILLSVLLALLLTL